MTALCSTAQAGNWYGVISAGAAHADSDYQSLVSAVNNANNTDTSNREHPWSFTGKLGGGYQLNDFFGVEGAFYWIGASKHDHAGTGDGAEDSGVRHSSHAEFKSWGFGIDAVGYLPVTDTVRFYGKAGAVFLRQTAENNASEPQYNFKDHENRVAPKLAVGGEWSVTERVALRLEYERIFKAAKTVETSSGAITSADTDYDMITFGVRCNF